MRVHKAEIAVIGIDLGKNSCSLVALDGNGAVVKRRRMRPATTVAFVRSCQPVSSPWKPAEAPPSRPSAGQAGPPGQADVAGLTIDPRFGILSLTMAPVDAARFMRTGTRGSPSWPR